MASFIIQAEPEKTEFNLSLSYENELLPDSKETKSGFYLFGCWSKKKIGKGRSEWGDKWCWRPLDHYYATLRPRQTHHGKPHNSSQTQAAMTNQLIHDLEITVHHVSINWCLHQLIIWKPIKTGVGLEYCLTSLAVYSCSFLHYQILHASFTNQKLFEYV